MSDPTPSEAGLAEQAQLALKLLGPALIDAWYVVDEADRILDFNAAFHALFPRAVGRQLKGMSCRDACQLPACASQSCLRVRCGQGGALRMDEVEAQIGGETLRLIVSAVPLPTRAGSGALIILRNVTDEARVQADYQRLVDSAGQVKRELEVKLEARTRDLLAANGELNRLEREIAKLKRGGI